MRATRVFLVATAALALTLQPSLAGESKQDLARSYLSQRKVEKQLKALRAQVAQGLMSYRSRLGRDNYELVQASMERNFDGEALFRVYQKSFQDHVQEAPLKKVIAWYERPLGAKLLKLEDQGVSSESAAALQAFARAQARKPVSAGRSRLIAELDRAQKSSEVLVDITLNVTKAILSGIYATSDQDFDPDKVAKQVTELRRTVRPKVEKSVRTTLLFSFRDVPDNELQEYAEFLKTREATAVSEASFIALNETLETAATGVGEEVGSLELARKKNAGAKEAE